VEERRRHLARLNTLIAVTGTYFSQGEEEMAALAAATGAVVASEVEVEEQEQEEEGEIREGG
jgi:hypothetical protein